MLIGSGRKTNKAFSISDQLIKRLEAEKRKTGVPTSLLVETAIWEYLQGQQQTEDESYE
jgi:hypothetical protein